MTRFLLIVLTWFVLTASASAQMTLTGAGGTPKPATSGISGWCGLISQSGLQNCWPFDTAHTTTAVATDVVGGENATLANVTLAGAGPGANLNNAGVFNGSSSIGATSLANLPAAAFTLVLWVKAGTTGGRIMANDHTDEDNKGFQIIYSPGSPNNVTGNFGNGATNTNNAANPVPTNTWTMVSFTYDGTTVASYIGSTFVGNVGPMAGPIAAGTNNIAFGYNPAYSGDYFAGSIAGIAIWSRELSSAEISAIAGL